MGCVYRLRKITKCPPTADKAEKHSNEPDEPFYICPSKTRDEQNNHSYVMARTYSIPEDIKMANQSWLNRSAVATPLNLQSIPVLQEHLLSNGVFFH